MRLLFDFWEFCGKFFGGAVGVLIIAAIWYLYELIAYPGIKKFRKSVEDAGFDSEQSKFLIECFKHKRDTSELWDKSYSVGQMKEILREQNRQKNK